MIYSKVALGLLIMVFFYISVVNFHFSVPAVVPPHTGGQTGHFVEEFAIGVKVLHELFEFLAFSGPSWRGRRASLKIKAKQRKALQGIAKPSLATHMQVIA